MSQPLLIDNEPDERIPADGEVVLEADWNAPRDYGGGLYVIAYWWPGRCWLPDKPSAQGFQMNPEELAERFENPTVYGTEPRRVRVMQVTR